MTTTTYPVTTNSLSIADPYANHVASIEKTKVHANGVHPDAVWKLRVPDTDMPRYALGEAHASPVSENSCHVRDNVLAMLMVGGKFGNACNSERRI
jgi:hypothetical protein